MPDIYEDGSASFAFGKAGLLREGNDCTIISAGEALFHALQAADELARRGVRARLIDMPTIKPIDTEAVLAAARETGFIVTVEEHSIHGGLGAAVAEIVVQNHPVPMKMIAFPDEFVPAGTSAELFAHYGITGPAIAEAVKELLRSSAPGRAGGFARTELVVPRRRLLCPRCGPKLERLSGFPLGDE